MSLREHAAVIGVLMAVLAPATAWAWGVPGCTNLPEYNRALGALQGMTSACDMTVDQARRIVAAHDGPAAVDQPATPSPDTRHRRNRERKSDR